MNKIIISILLIHFSIFANAQLQINQSPPGFYTNPIFAGDYPDPSILRDGDNYCTGQDAGHFDSQGYRKLGERYGVKMLELLRSK